MYWDSRLFAMTQGTRWRIALAAILGLIAVAAGVGRLAVAGWIIALVFRGEAGFNELLGLLALMAVLVAVKNVFHYWQQSVSHHTSNIIRVKLRERLSQHSLALGPGHFDQKRTGDVALTLADNVESLQIFFGQYIPQFIVSGFAPILIFWFMAWLDLQIALIFLAFAVFTIVAPGIFQRWNRDSSLKRRSAYGALGADFLDSVQGLTTLKAFGQSKQRGAMLADRARQLYRSTMGVLAANIVTTGVTVLGISAGAAAVLVVGAPRVVEGDLALRTLLIVMMLGVEVFRPMRELVQLYHHGMVAMSASQSVFELLDASPSVTAPAAPESQNGSRPTALTPELAFENVAFAYPGGRQPALRGLSFTLRAGEKLGVVGPSGAGKSTLVWLALRFHDPSSGRISLGGHDLRQLPLETIRESIAVVTQDTYLFNGTVADNLRFGKPDATQEELERAARDANAHEFISQLPQGYETVVGERAMRLSGGQRQRIAIARALLKDAPILILDEALSSVDAENEAIIQEALDRLMEGRTTLIIAHRLSSVIKADRIIALERGQLAESGTHAELIARGGVYAQLMAQQQTSPEQDALIATAPQPGAANGEARFGGAETAIVATLNDDHSHAGDGGHDHGANGHVHHADGHDQEGLETPGVTAASPVSTWQVFRRLFGLIRPWWKQQLATFVLGVANYGSVVALGVVSALLVGQVYHSIIGDGGNITPYIWILLALVPATALFAWAESWLAHDLAYRLLAEMRIDLYRKLDPLAPAYTVRRKSGDLVSLMGGDVETIEYFFAHTISPAFVAVVVPLNALIVLGLIAWPVALALLPFLIATAVRPFYAQRNNERKGAAVRENLGELHAQVVDNVQGMREISAFNQGPRRVKGIVEQSWRVARNQLEFLKAQAAQASFIDAMMGLGGLAVLATGVWLVTNGQMARPELPLVTALALATFHPVSDLARTYKHLMETLAAGRRVFAIHDEPVPVLDGPGAALAAPARNGAAPAVRFSHVTFAYGPGLRPALTDVSFTAQSGQTVALVGRSGAGKTTCAYLLLRFWDPQQGRVMLGDQDIGQFTLDELRQNIALVSQDTYLFNTSIRENIRLGRPEATDAEIAEAAQQANAHEFIDSFPEGYDTLVGERGMQLSGGQRQRIAIARAILKNAPVLILDEATSHLDAINEQLVRQALARLMRGRTTLVIAHRLSTIRDADQIVVLDGGSVAAAGSHQHLLRHSGLYAQLVSRQMVNANGPNGAAPQINPAQAASSV